MTDVAALALARTVTPEATGCPPRARDPVAALARSRRDPVGRVTIWPTCSRAGHPSALAQLVDPIDPLDPHDDGPRLAVRARATRHAARVLAAAVLSGP